MQAGPDLFGDAMVEEPPAPSSRRPRGATREVSLSAAVLGSEIFTSQRELAGRVALSDEQVGAALDALAAAPSTRLPVPALASVMSLPTARAQGALAQLQRLLNVEGYPVLRTEGPAVILDRPLLREQFGIGR